MSQRTTISHLLLRLSLKEAAHIPRQQLSRNISLSQRKGELKKTHHQIQLLILLRQMTIAIRRKRRRLQLPLQRQALASLKRLRGLFKVPLQSSKLLQLSQLQPLIS
jgi:hypothetical protein